MENRVVGRRHWWCRNERSVTVVRGRKDKGRCCFWTGSIAAGAGAGGEARSDAEDEDRGGRGCGLAIIAQNAQYFIFDYIKKLKIG